MFVCFSWIPKRKHVFRRRTESARSIPHYRDNVLSARATSRTTICYACTRIRLCSEMVQAGRQVRRNRVLSHENDDSHRSRDMYRCSSRILDSRSLHCVFRCARELRVNMTRTIYASSLLLLRIRSRFTNDFSCVARTRSIERTCMRSMRVQRCANLLSRHCSHIKSILRYDDEIFACYETTTSSLSLNKRTRPNTCYVAPVAKEHSFHIEVCVYVCIYIQMETIMPFHVNWRALVTSLYAAILLDRIKRIRRRIED